MDIQMISQLLLLAILCGIAYLDRKFREETKQLIKQQNEEIDRLKKELIDADLIFG